MKGYDENIHRKVKVFKLFYTMWKNSLYKWISICYYQIIKRSTKLPMD